MKISLWLFRTTVIIKHKSKNLLEMCLLVRWIELFYFKQVLLFVTEYNLLHQFYSSFVLKNAIAEERYLYKLADGNRVFFWQYHSFEVLSYVENGPVIHYQKWF